MTKPYHLQTKDEWSTPQDLFDMLNRVYRFTIDAAASPENTKHPRFWTVADDALTKDWKEERVWCNPPYSKWQKFVKHGFHCGGFCVFLLAARTDTIAFHELIWQEDRPREGVRVVFLKGRLKFNGSKHPAPFPSMLVIFEGVK